MTSLPGRRCCPHSVADARRPPRRAAYDLDRMPDRGLYWSISTVLCVCSGRLGGLDVSEVLRIAFVEGRVCRRSASGTEPGTGSSGWTLRGVDRAGPDCGDGRAEVKEGREIRRPWLVAIERDAPEVAFRMSRPPALE